MRFGPSRYAISRRCCCRCQQKATADENDPYCDHAAQIETDTCHHVSCSPSTLGLSHSVESNRRVNLREAVASWVLGTTSNQSALRWVVLSWSVARNPSDTDALAHAIALRFRRGSSI